MSIEPINGFVVKGYKEIKSDIKYPITEDTTIELKGEFCSSGKIKSKLYFGLKSFKENGEEIFAYHINRINEPLLITSISSDGKSITLNQKPEKWNNQSENDDYSQRVRKYLGIYFDGNINRLADYILHTPAYKIYTDNNLYLNREIPKDIRDKIIPYQTKIMNHFSSGTYDYSAACGDEVPEKWTIYKAEYKGFSKGFGDIRGQFRLETKSICPFMICNYSQNDDAILNVKDVEIIVKDKPKFN